MTKEKIEESARRSGIVTIPIGQCIKVDKPEKAFALAAQTMSSYIFREGLISAVNLCKQYRSKIIFTVHDEVVVDLHPNEMYLIEIIKQRLVDNRYRYDYKVKHKLGNTYEEATS